MYPSCRDCRKSATLATLANNPMCSRCKVNPHQPSNMYCYDCGRVAKGYTEPPKFRRDAWNTLCSKCKVNPKANGKNYCSECANKYLRDRYARMGGQRKYMTDEQKRLTTVRQYAHSLLKAGKVKRTDCVFCGAPGTEFHHYDYENRTRNFESVCNPCHDEAHLFLNSMLTMMKMGAKFPALDTA